MRQLLFFITILIVSLSCKTKTPTVKIPAKKDISDVRIADVLIRDSISIRALSILKDSILGFGYDKGYGFYDIAKNKLLINKITIPKRLAGNAPNWICEQRAVFFNDFNFFSVGIESPARIRKINIKDRSREVVYMEAHPKAFYDAISFWNAQEGIAIGDPTESCMSIVITRDGGTTWEKISCDKLPKTVDGEAAFAASNSTIAIVGDAVWIATGGIKSRIIFSPDKGKTWELYETPIIQGQKTTGMYSIDFYDRLNGYAIGGDYTNPENNISNKIKTIDGGKTWAVVADSISPGYRSCVKYIPNSNGKQLVTVGTRGISISNDAGLSWKKISEEPFYTVEFLDDSIAFAAGKTRICRLLFY